MTTSTAPTHDSTEELVRHLVTPGVITPSMQPIVRLTDGEVVGYEALSRAPSAPGTPDRWFAAATAADDPALGPQLEAACLHAIADVGPPPEGRLRFVNVTPGHIGSPLVVAALDRLDGPTVIELTEQEAIADLTALRRHLARWISRGMRVALDDVGSGYAGLQQIVRLRPEFLKLDRGLIAGIDSDRTRQSLVASLVGFARQAGTSIVAEGIETDRQLLWLREAGVTLGQGFFFARPAPGWPALVTGTTAGSTLRASVLATRLDAATTAREACEAAADHLFGLGNVMPSIYVAAGGRLRCLAQRGLWQVLDGMAPSAGITGRVFRSGRSHYVKDVADSADYLEAIPGVVSEFCTPIRSGGRVVGALNVESTSPLDPEICDEVTTVADLLGARITALPSEPGTGPLRHLAGLAASLVAVSDPDATATAVVRAGCELTGLDSGVVVLDDDQHLVPEMVGAHGPLGAALAALPRADVDRLVTVLAPLTSCYSSGESTGRTMIGGTTLRSAGACAVVALPLVARGRRTGLVLLAGTTPVSLGAEVIEPAELLATLAGSCLEVASHLDDLESRVRLDALTGLENHARFHEHLRELSDEPDLAVIMLDVDGFKQVNDTHGHLVGDELLRGIAEAMAGSTRSETLLYRVGGDEIAAVVSGPGCDHAVVLADRLRTVAAPLLEPYGAGISAGVAIRHPGEAAIDTLARADASLYRAKRDGNGVVAA